MAFVNQQRVLAQYRRFGQGWFDGAVEGLRRGAAEMHHRAKFVYTPIDTGDLRNSSKVEMIERAPPRAVMEITFGDADTPYAALVHERLDLRHASPTQAKYLQRAVDELLPQMTELVGRGATISAKRRL